VGILDATTDRQGHSVLLNSRNFLQIQFLRTTVLSWMIVSLKALVCDRLSLNSISAIALILKASLLTLLPNTNLERKRQSEQRS
jgi:hypothetical protein